MTDSKNTILAIVLSAIVLIGWQFFFAAPQEKARQEKLQQEQAQALKNAPKVKNFMVGPLPNLILPEEDRPL